MKVTRYKGDLSCVAEGTGAEVFKQLSEFSETFQDSCCGACKSENIDYVVRKVEDNEFYEMVCRNSQCRAKLSFGHSKADSKLYPKRVVTDNKGKAVKDVNGKAQYLPNNGWTVYRPEDK